MVRHIPGPTYNIKLDTFWPQKWSKIPRYPFDNLEKYMRKVLIYYPKNLKVLKPITTELGTKLTDLSQYFGDDTEEEITHLETLYMQILAKYKRSYTTHQNIDINYEDPYTYRPNRLDSLRLYQSEEGELPIPDVLKRSLKLCKGVKHVEIDESVTYCVDILKHIRYVPSLQSIYIDHFTYITSRELEVLAKLFRSCKTSLKTITIIGVWKTNPSKFFHMLAQLLKLETVNLEGEFPVKFCIQQIPYKMFKERDIRFNIKLRYWKGELKFSTKNRLGIAPVDFLGICHQNSFSRLRSSTQDFILEDLTVLQNHAKRVMLFSFPLGACYKKMRMSKLFRACKDVEVLDICLVRGWYSWNQNEFNNLRCMKNLKHVFITLDNAAAVYYSNGDKTIASYDGFFRNLAYCASSLRSINLHLYGGIDVKDRIAKLFKACADTVTHLTLKFTYYSYTNTKNTKNSYSCLKELKNLTSLKVIYEGFFPTTFGPHANKTPFINTTLKEISLMAPIISLNQLHMEFQRLVNLEKIQLCIFSLTDDSRFFRNKFVMSGSIKHIELELVFVSQNIWHNLLVQFNKLSALEILMLKIGGIMISGNNSHEIKTEMMINDLKTLIKGHRSLKCVTYGFGWDPDTVCVFIENVDCCSDEEIDRFYGRNLPEILRRRMQRVYKVQKEIMEEIVMSKIPVEVNRGFTGFLKDLYLNVKSRYFENNG